MKHDQINTQPAIETERFILRPLRKSDAGLIAHYAGDERVSRNTGSMPHPYPPGAAEAFIARTAAQDRVENAWAIDSTALGGAELMGVVNLKHIEEGQAEIGYWIAPAYWSSQIASDAVAALVQANPLNLRMLFATVFQDNPASARVLTKTGFTYLGDAEGYSVARGANVPTWTYSRKMDR